MKKTLIALAALASTAAFAQSNVSISGGLRLGYGASTAGVTGVSTTQGSGNQINFNISEDLGGGMKANARTQIRFNMDNGTNSSGFANAATNPTGVGAPTRIFHLAHIGLSGGFGAVDIGTIGFDGQWAYTAFGSTTAGVALNAAFGGGQGAGATEAGQYRYTLPAFVKGLTLQIGGADRDNTGGTQNSTYLRATYAMGPVSVTAVNEKNTAVTTMVNSTNFGGSYDLGVAKINAIYSKAENSAGTETAKGFTLSATAPMGALTLKAGYKNDGLAANNDVTAFGVDYALSKRTALEVNTWKISNSAANPDNAYWIGVRHSF
jgi:hypothetical protein